MSELEPENPQADASSAYPALSDSPSPPPPEITTRILDFLSTASNEKLGACALGLGVATYFVLGRLGLVLIGAAGGIVLHATWEGTHHKDNTTVQIEQKRRRETGLDVVQRLLDWQGAHKAHDVLEPSTVATDDLNFDGFQPETSAALTKIVDRVIEDYVRWWYSPMLPEENSFPHTCRQTLTSFLLSFSNHLAKKRAEDIFLNFLTNSISIFIVFLSELSKALMPPGSTRLESTEAIAVYLRDYPNSSFANVLDRAEQGRKLKAVAEDILQTYLESSAYRFAPAKTFLTEVLANLILEPTLVTCSKAEWINGWIVYLLEAGEPEIMNAINAGVGEATGKPIPTTTLNQETAESKPVKSIEEDDEDREALEEVRRLNALIAAETPRLQNEFEEAKDIEQPKATKESDETESSAPSINNVLTPTSSHSDLAGSKSHNSLHEQANPESLEREENIAVNNAPFTSFDQIVPQEQLFTEPVKPLPLTLHKATVTIFDDSQPGEKSTVRAKPSIDYLLQIEPASSQHPGWMIARKYADFETLHEVLRRISVISGIPEFGNKYAVVPAWKGQTKSAVRVGLEDYLREALSHSRLAESEGMKRFLEKDEGLEKLGNSKGGLAFPTPEAFQTMGKGMLDALASAPKGAAGGGKALLDGMKGVGNVFAKPKKLNRPNHGQRNDSVSTLPGLPDEQMNRSETKLSENRMSESNDNSIFPSRTSYEFSRPSLQSRNSTESIESISRENPSQHVSRSSSRYNSTLKEDVIPEDEDTRSKISSQEILNLPPRPDEIDDQGILGAPRIEQTPSISAAASIIETTEPLAETQEASDSPQAELNARDEPNRTKTQKPKIPFTTEETSVAVELIFATISELYTLSSAWNIRKALLNAAKVFLIRPGNPSLEQIRVLLQESVIDANTTDAGIAYQLLKLRENSLPTEAELAAWPPPTSAEAKEKLRIKARRLLVEQGLPPALRGIMGAVATGEALGRLFDSLQIEEVSRGLMFAIMLQSIRAVTH